MSAPVEKATSALRAEARRLAARAYAPYSGRAEAAVVLLSDGAWIPGVRVESASFSLLIPALLNAYTTAVAAGRRDVVLAVLNHEAGAAERALMEAFYGPEAVSFAPDTFRVGDAEDYPSVGEVLPAALEAGPLPPDDPAPGLALAREVATRALVPESDFPVACVLESEDGALVPGVNVEHSDWTRILCAERNALGTLRSYGLPPPRRAFLTCSHDAGCSPCGACRQLLAELAPDVRLYMDRGEHPPEVAVPAQLLPGSFTGRSLVRER